MTVNYNFVIVVDAKLQWSIFCVKNIPEEEPIEMYKGRFVSEREEIKKVVGVYCIEEKLIVVFDKFQPFYLQLPKTLPFKQ